MIHISKSFLLRTDTIIKHNFASKHFKNNNILSCLKKKIFLTKFSSIRQTTAKVKSTLCLYTSIIYSYIYLSIYFIYEYLRNIFRIRLFWYDCYPLKMRTGNMYFSFNEFFRNRYTRIWLFCTMYVKFDYRTYSTESTRVWLSMP